MFFFLTIYEFFLSVPMAGLIFGSNLHEEFDVICIYAYTMFVASNKLKDKTEKQRKK